MLEHAVALAPESNLRLVAEASDILGRDLLGHYRADQPPSIFATNRDVQVGVFLANHLAFRSFERSSASATRSLGLGPGGSRPPGPHRSAGLRARPAARRRARQGIRRTCARAGGRRRDRTPVDGRARKDWLLSCAADVLARLAAGALAANEAALPVHGLGAQHVVAHAGRLDLSAWAARLPTVALARVDRLPCRTCREREVRRRRLYGGGGSVARLAINASNPPASVLKSRPSGSATL